MLNFKRIKKWFEEEDEIADIFYFLRKLDEKGERIGQSLVNISTSETELFYMPNKDLARFLRLYYERIMNEHKKM